MSKKVDYTIRRWLHTSIHFSYSSQEKICMIILQLAVFFLTFNSTCKKFQRLFLIFNTTWQFDYVTLRVGRFTEPVVKYTLLISYYHARQIFLFLWMLRPKQMVLFNIFQHSIYIYMYVLPWFVCLCLYLRVCLSVCESRVCTRTLINRLIS